MRRVLEGVWLASLTVPVIGCDLRGVTANKIEDAMAPTFANLVQLQESKLGLPPVEAVTLQAMARCRKVGPGDETRGGGNWICSVLWVFPGYKGPLRDTYDLSVTSDGCYTATSEEGHFGGPTLTTRDGAKVANLLYAFDGCFDPS
jgi:hypothetical protein